MSLNVLVQGGCLRILHGTITLMDQALVMMIIQPHGSMCLAIDSILDDLGARSMIQLQLTLRLGILCISTGVAMGVGTMLLYVLDTMLLECPL